MFIMLLLGAAIVWTLSQPAARAQGRGGRGGGGRGGQGQGAFGGGAGAFGAQGGFGSQVPTLGSAGLIGDPGGQFGGATFQYDPETNTIMVITNENTWDLIQGVVTSLDRPVPQALIKVLFLEVTHTDDYQFGFTGSMPINNGVVNNGTLATVLSALPTEGAVAQVLYQDLNATLRALAQTSKLNVLSRPSILARNNTEATITIGQQVPRITNSRITDQGQTINTITYDDIGIILRVTPYISNNNTVQMDVAPEITTLTGESVAVSFGADGSTNATAPVYATRSAETSVVVPSGATVVIGGLMEDQITDNVQKVPWLGDIPVLGLLFKRTVKSKTKTELLIFLTPNVVQRLNELELMTDTEKQRHEEIRNSVPSELLNRYEVERTPTATEQERF
jgi:general secretion pathway protein D